MCAQKRQNRLPFVNHYTAFFDYMKTKSPIYHVYKSFKYKILLYARVAAPNVQSLGPREHCQFARRLVRFEPSNIQKVIVEFL